MPSWVWVAEGNRKHEELSLEGPATRWRQSRGRAHLQLPVHTSRLRGGFEFGLVSTPGHAQRVGVNYRVSLTLCPKLPHLRKGKYVCPHSLVGISSVVQLPSGVESLKGSLRSG